VTIARTRRTSEPRSGRGGQFVNGIGGKSPHIAPPLVRDEMHRKAARARAWLKAAPK